MERFTTLASPNNINFVLDSKRFVCSGMGIVGTSPLSNTIHGSSLLKTIQVKVSIFKM